MSLAVVNAQTAGFEGNYVMSANGQTANLQIAPYDGGIAGQLAIGNESATLVGTVNGNRSEGVIQDNGNGQMSAYTATVSGSRLDLTLLIVDPNTFQTTPVTLNFTRGNAAAAQQTTTAPARTTVSGSGSAGGSNSAVAKEWKNLLADTRLTYMDSYSSGYGDNYGGYSVERKIELCSRGFFTYSGNSNFSVNAPAATGYSYGNSGGDGTWSVIDSGNGGAILQLNFNDGSTAQYNLGYQNGKTFLNGERWFRVTAAEGGDYAPVSCY
ncbi:hypothetical protein BVG80_05310 [Sphingobacteriales bacterium TSM_CSM]|nr:hypothetical protein BVG80_05310 [Sphingobacteriales bacterium TSM_CSM]